MTKDKLIIEKQAEIIAHFKELFKILGYEICQPETTSESLFLELSTLQAEEEENGNSHIHYFVDGVCMYCGAKMDYINAC
jgi:hypothetical protein